MFRFACFFHIDYSLLAPLQNIFIFYMVGLFWIAVLAFSLYTIVWKYYHHRVSNSLLVLVCMHMAARLEFICTIKYEIAYTWPYVIDQTNCIGCVGGNKITQVKFTSLICCICYFYLASPWYPMWCLFIGKRTKTF